MGLFHSFIYVGLSWRLVWVLRSMAVHRSTSMHSITFHAVGPLWRRRRRRKFDEWFMCQSPEVRSTGRRPIATNSPSQHMHYACARWRIQHRVMAVTWCTTACKTLNCLHRTTFEDKGVTLFKTFKMFIIMHFVYNFNVHMIKILFILKIFVAKGQYFTT